MSTIVPILFCFWGACFTHNCCETTKQKTFSKNCITDRTNCPFLSWLSRRSFFFRCPLITEYTAEQVHNPRMSECRTPRRWSSQEVMDKLFRSDQRPCTPDGGRSGAMTARGLKDTSSRPAKDWGEPCGARYERRCGVMTAAPAETCSVPGVRDACKCGVLSFNEIMTAVLKLLNNIPVRLFAL